MSKKITRKKPLRWCLVFTGLKSKKRWWSASFPHTFSTKRAAEEYKTVYVSSQALIKYEVVRLTQKLQRESFR